MTSDKNDHCFEKMCYMQTTAEDEDVVELNQNGMDDFDSEAESEKDAQTGHVQGQAEENDFDDPIQRIGSDPQNQSQTGCSSSKAETTKH